jgi:8-oxo-dGTP diphosphatase
MSHYAKIIGNLSKMLKPVTELQNADAAVALLLRPVDQDFKILLVKRTENPSDPWSGQMAFPGGKRDPKDQDLKHTVVRETLEETNIDINCRCRFLGALENMRSTVRPKLLVAPFAVLLENEPTIILNKELEGYMWVSLKKLRECKGVAKFPFGEVPAYIVEGNAIWGLTCRILGIFIQIFRQAIRNHSPL